MLLQLSRIYIKSNKNSKDLKNIKHLEMWVTEYSVMKSSA